MSGDRTERQREENVFHQEEYGVGKTGLQL